MSDAGWIWRVPESDREILPMPQSSRADPNPHPEDGCVSGGSSLRPAHQLSPAAAAAAAILAAASRAERSSPMVRPDLAASSGLTSRRASKVVP